MSDRDDDRPKKTWRERDQAKTSGKRPQQERSEPRPRGAEQHAYNVYKSQLNRLFEQGLGAPSAERVARRDEQKALLAHTNPVALQKAVKAYIAQHGEPEDEEVWARCLDVLDEALIEQALTVLLDRAEQKTLKRAQAVKSRLKTLLLTCDAPKVLKKAKTLLNALG